MTTVPPAQLITSMAIYTLVGAAMTQLVRPLNRACNGLYQRAIGARALDHYLATGAKSWLWSPPPWATRLRRYTEQTTQLAGSGIDAVCLGTGLGAGITTSRHLAERYELEPAKALALQTSGAVLGTSAGYVLKEPIKQRALPALHNWLVYPWRH
jgi:hypothetical protein